MRRVTLLWMAVSLVLAACSLSHDAPTIITATPLPSPSATPVTPTPTPLPALESDTGSYADVTAWLDGVCFDYLVTLDGARWVWTAAEEMAAFFDQVDASELCGQAIPRPEYDFSAGIVAGVVSVTTGCDTAYRVVSLTQDAAAHAQTLRLSLDVRPGCPYELVEPLLVLVPSSPAGYTLAVAVSAP